MIIECVPNISEARDADVLNEAEQAVRSVPSCTLMDVQKDRDHNRSVFSFLGEPEAVLEAAFALAQVCVENVDLRKQSGVHPRMGAIDVIPFVPIKGASMQDCIDLAHGLGNRLWSELRLPVYLYEQAATAPHRKNLADVRRGQFEGLKEKMQRAEWQPDYGNAAPHASAGAVAVGARKPLIAYNINLTTADVEIAKKIAKQIRASNGGLPHVKALGLYLAAKDCAQVSINMTDYEVTPLYKVMEWVRALAQGYGTDILESELIGLAPMRAFADSAAHYLQLKDADLDRQILENHIF